MRNIVLALAAGLSAGCTIPLASPDAGCESLGGCTTPPGEDGSVDGGAIETAAYLIAIDFQPANSLPATCYRNNQIPFYRESSTGRKQQVWKILRQADGTEVLDLGQNWTVYIGQAESVNAGRLLPGDGGVFSVTQVQKVPLDPNAANPNYSSEMTGTVTVNGLDGGEAPRGVIAVSSAYSCTACTNNDNKVAFCSTSLPFVGRKVNVDDGGVIREGSANYQMAVDYSLLNALPGSCYKSGVVPALPRDAGVRSETWSFWEGPNAVRLLKLATKTYVIGEAEPIQLDDLSVGANDTWEQNRTAQNLANPNAANATYSNTTTGQARAVLQLAGSQLSGTLKLSSTYSCTSCALGMAADNKVASCSVTLPVSGQLIP